MAFDSALTVFRAIGEETRLRILALLARGELTVTELTQILSQSQPRVSRHLKILTDAGLVERHREGAWMFYRRAPAREAGETLAGVAAAIEALLRSGDRVIERDGERFAQSREARAAVAARYFERNAAEWSRLRALHLPQTDIETQLIALAGDAPISLMIDLGTGAGRMLELLAPRAEAAIGYDLSHEMLAIARATLEKAGLANAQARHGDLFAVPLASEAADLVVMHHVLHYLAEPEAAVREAARLLKPGGRLVISDFAPHDLEFLRDDHAHRRLGFSDSEAEHWFARAGLNAERVKTLTPKNPDAENDRTLTVKIWTATAPANVRRVARARRAAAH